MRGWYKCLKKNKEKLYSKPTLNWIYPDESMAKYAEIKNVDIEDMVLLHSCSDGVGVAV